MTTLASESFLRELNAAVLRDRVDTVNDRIIRSFLKLFGYFGVLLA